MIRMCSFKNIITEDENYIEIITTCLNNERSMFNFSGFYTILNAFISTPIKMDAIYMFYQ